MKKLKMKSLNKVLRKLPNNKTLRKLYYSFVLGMSVILFALLLILGMALITFVIYYFEGNFEYFYNYEIWIMIKDLFVVMPYIIFFLLMIFSPYLMSWAQEKLRDLQ